MKISALMACLSLVLSISCSVDTTDRIAVGDWKFLDNNSRFEIAAPPADGWKPVQKGYRERFIIIPHTDRDYRWFRGKFFITGDPSRFYGISMGLIEDAGDVYINNITAPAHVNNMLSNRHFSMSYVIPEGSVRRGDNYLYARINSLYSNDERALAKISIMTKRDFEVRQFYSIITYVIAPFGLIILYFGVTILDILVFFLSVRGRYFLYSALMGFFSVLFILSISMPHRLPGDYSILPWLNALMVFIMPLYGINYVLLIQSLYGVYISSYTRVGVAVSIAFYLFMVAFGNKLTGLLAMIIVLNIYPLIMAVILTILISAINAIRPDRVKLYLIYFMMLITAVGFFLEDIALLFRIVNPGIILIYSLFPASIVLMFLVIWQSYNAWTALRELYEKLKLSDKSMKKSVDYGVLSITEMSEIKLKKVIEFIDENYKSDISREGLAAAVHMSPNYLGRLFLSYQHKTINEYINDLRVRDSIEKLKNTDEKILNIALEAGYESLSTFNRVFKKVTGTTPTDCRNGL